MHRHVALAALVVLAAALRVIALVAVYPGIWFSDTNGYVAAAATGQLSRLRVDGYSLVVAPFYRLVSAGALIVNQHLIGLAIVVVLYALLVRRGVPRWLALLGVVPAALDAYLIDIEHMIMSETVFHASIVAAVALLLWNDRFRPWLVAAAGLSLGYAAMVRSVAMAFVVVVVLYLLLRRAGLRQMAAFCAGWALVVGGYGALYAAQHGRFGFTGYDGRFLYAQIAPYADCAQVAVPATERPLCPNRSHRLSRNSYLWSPRSPIHRLPTSADGVIRDFAVRVIRDNPLGYLRVVAGNFAHYFEPGPPHGS